MTEKQLESTALITVQGRSLVLGEWRKIAARSLKMLAESQHRATSDYRLVDLGEAQAMLDEAEASFARGDVERARELYEPFIIPELEQLPCHWPPYQDIVINYAVCLSNVGRPGDAANALALLEGVPGKPAGYYVNLSFALLRQGRWHEVRTCCLEGLEGFPNDGDLVGNALIAATQLQHYREGRELAERRLQPFPQFAGCGVEINPLNYFSPEKAQHADIKHENSAHGSDVARALDDVAGFAGRVFFDLREQDWPAATWWGRRAVELYREAKKLDPEAPNIRYNLASRLKQLERFDEARQELIDLAALPAGAAYNELSAHLYGECLSMEGGQIEAVKHAEQWLEIFPHSTALERLRGEAFAELCIGKFTDEGERLLYREPMVFFEGIFEGPDELSLNDHFYWARLLEWTGRTDEALEVIKKAELISPQAWQVAHHRAEFYSRAGLHDEATRWSREATERSPWRQCVWVMLSFVLQQSGRCTEAEEASANAQQVGRTRFEYVSGTLRLEDDDPRLRQLG